MNPQRAKDDRRRKGALLIAALFALAAVAAALDRTGTAPARALLIGDFTGEITPDGPVYRTPPIEVVANRNAELARIEREERLDRARDRRHVGSSRTHWRSAFLNQTAGSTFVTAPPAPPDSWRNPLPDS